MIDLRSDTVTRPTQQMREAAASADVGDDVFGEDPSVNEFETEAASILSTEAALFVTSGTMANQIAARVHTDRGQEVLCERNSHIYRWELGGLAQHSALQTRPLAGDDRGALAPEQIRNNIVEQDDHRPGTGLLTLENTHNAAGGTALSSDTIDAAAAEARQAGVPVHLDGARLWNATTALDCRPAAFTGSVDSVMCALSKGLGAPVGSVLAGSEAFITAARRIRKLLGGGWRQAGIIAAPAHVAIKNRDHLADDHAKAKRLAAGIDGVDGLSAAEPETNIVVARTDQPAAERADAFVDGGVGCAAFGPHRIRFVTHRDVDDNAIDDAIERIRSTS